MIRFLKKILLPSKKKPLDKSNEPLSEEEFYTNLFTKNKLWSTKEPNEEEQRRWQIIEQFVFFVKGWYSSLHKQDKLQILDLGCGRGWLTNLLSQHGNITGIEPVKPVVDFGKQYFPDLDLLHGTAGDLLQKGFQSRYDIIVSSEVIEHIPDDKKPAFVKDIKTLLKPQGFAIITTPRKEAEEEWLNYCGDGQPVEDWITENQLKDFFESQNFTVHLNRRMNHITGDTSEIEIYQLWLFQKND